MFIVCLSFMGSFVGGLFGLVVRPLVILSLARVGGAASPFGGHLSPELYADGASLVLFQSCVPCHVFLFFSWR